MIINPELKAEFINASILIENILAEIEKATKRFPHEQSFKATAAFKSIKKAQPDITRDCVIIIWDLLTETKTCFFQHQEFTANPENDRKQFKMDQAHTHLLFLQQQLLNKQLPFTEEQLCRVYEYWAELIHSDDSWLTTATMRSSNGLIKNGEALLKSIPGAGKLDPALKIIVAKLDQYSGAEDRRKVARLRSLLSDIPNLPLTDIEIWSEAAISMISCSDGSTKNQWTQLINFAATAKTGKPGNKWIDEALHITKTWDQPGFTDAIEQWFPLVGLPRTKGLTVHEKMRGETIETIPDIHADVLKGLALICGVLKNPKLTDSLNKLAQSTYQRLPGIGPRNIKVGNACVWALGQIGGESAVAALSKLKAKVSVKPAQKAITTALRNISEQAGVTPEELEEIAVPTYSLTGVGIREASFDEFHAKLTLISSMKAELTWIKAGGKSQKSVPKYIRDNFSEPLKQFRQTGKDSIKLLSALKIRLDKIMSTDRSWTVNDWQARYIDHYLQGVLGRRLIWSFQYPDFICSGIYLNGNIVTVNGSNLGPLEKVTEVCLWHPINAPVEEVVQWRQFLETNKIVQPFKQAHREIYLLTDAEKKTEIYSNRFASHIIKQHQFNALCSSRGWLNRLRLDVDDDYSPPSLLLKELSLLAQLWVEPVIDAGESVINEAGIYQFLATDQVRFYRHMAPGSASGRKRPSHQELTSANEPLRLVDIPAKQFSEVLRDVDLFIGVASVGNDPNWSDGGPEGRFTDYWSSYSFGELSATAKSRRETIARLIPTLKIRSQCKIEERFLVVTGELRTYKIHLGSGNILMEPNDQYLCIVPTQNTGERANQIFLPFEGDNRLSAILSKAFLLASDRKITDKTILSQIESKI